MEEIVMPRRPTHSRCPACNPMNFTSKKAREHAFATKKLPACAICQNTRKLPVERAAAWMMGFNEVTPSYITAKPVSRTSLHFVSSV